MMNKSVRTLLIVGGLLNFVLAYMFFQKMEWTIGFWSWDTGGALSFIFMASMQAAIAVAMIWIGVSGETAALAAGALNLAVMMAGLALSLFFMITPDGAYMWGLAAFCLLFALFNLWLFWRTQRIPIQDNRDTPRPVQYSYALFIAALLGVGIGLLFQWPNVLSWNAPPVTLVLFGWMFFGDAFYFGYALYRGKWGLACAPLLSFLAYDLVLIQPFIMRLLWEDLPIMRRLSLAVYICVLLYSGALAIYYLFLHKETALWRSNVDSSWQGSKVAG